MDMAEVMATTMVGGIIAITRDLTSESEAANETARLKQRVVSNAVMPGLEPGIHVFGSGAQ